jgi:hypothetical protein
MYRVSVVPGYSRTKEQAIFGSGIINGAFVGLVNSNGATMWRIRVERDGGYDYENRIPLKKVAWNTNIATTAVGVMV